MTIFRHFENLNEINRFLDTYHLPQLSHNIKSLKRPISNNDPPYQEKPEPDDFTAEFYQTFSELFSIHFNLFKTVEIDGCLLNCFSEISITLIPNPGKDRRKIMMNRDAKTNKPTKKSTS